MTTSSDPSGELDRLASSLLQARPGPRLMPVDLYREADRYILTADLPGVEPESVDIDVDGQLLTIRAQRTAPRTEGAKWLVQERPAGTYLRQFGNGEGVDSANISASYDNGVLSLVIPVSEKAKPRKIHVLSQHSTQEQRPAGDPSTSQSWPDDKPHTDIEHAADVGRGTIQLDASRSRHAPKANTGDPFPDAERRNTRPCKTGRRACAQPSGLSTVVHPVFTKGVRP